MSFFAPYREEILVDVTLEKKIEEEEKTAAMFQKLIF
jgi:hypothetical protein